jgi:hypothetical protein
MPVAPDQPEVTLPEVEVTANRDFETPIEFAMAEEARQQQTLASQRKQINNGDWRVRLRLAPQSQYLYNDPAGAGILQPLVDTDGIIFPYTPKISLSYKATYQGTPLTHSNYTGYFYQNSSVDQIEVQCIFTAQDTYEANYLLAVIHFFRSVTKMFYGQDAQRGSPPPLVYLSGLGEYQFNEHSCAVTNFNYSLPSDVDYIRAGSVAQTSQNSNNQRNRQTVAVNNQKGGVQRLRAAALTKGAIPVSTVPAGPKTLNVNNPTYVPTKIDISISLIPILSRRQVSQNFSLQGYANGKLLRGGFW